MTTIRSNSAVLALNSGSSSLKFGLYHVISHTPKVVLSGEAEAIGDHSGRFWANDADGNSLVSESANFQTQRDAAARVRRFLSSHLDAQPFAIGHRVVHGGPELQQHCLIDTEVLRQLEAATIFAPLHNPPALEIICFAQRHFPNVPQIACFDTAFHSGMSEVARTLPIPLEFRSDGIRRYGFHGLSCESIVRQLGDKLPDRLIVAHLGNGTSVTAIEHGQSVDTSMGLTPAGGAMMGTRCGDLDPGVLIYLMRDRAFDDARLEALVNRQSGLLGISGIGGDMRDLHRASKTSAHARLAIRMFCYSIRKQIAAMIAALNGADLLVFTGGIGEHDAAVRAEICDGLSKLGVSLDSASDATLIPRCSVRVLPSQEDVQIALRTFDLVTTS
jgi:acetate kinase